jgi:hypothetical protein
VSAQGVKQLFGADIPIEYALTCLAAGGSGIVFSTASLCATYRPLSTLKRVHLPRPFATQSKHKDENHDRRGHNSSASNHPSHQAQYSPASRESRYTAGSFSQTIEWQTKAVRDAAGIFRGLWLLSVGDRRRLIKTLRRIDRASLGTG